MARLDAPVSVACCAIAMRNDEEFIVLHRCSDKEGTGTWSLPGGSADAGESPLDAAIRELREETNARVATLQPIFFWTYDRFSAEDAHSLTLFFIGEVENPDEVHSVEPHKHDELRWVTWDTLPTPLFPGLEDLALVCG